MSKEIKGLTFLKGYKSKNGAKPGKVFSTPLGYTYKINDIQDTNYNKYTGEKYLSNTYNVTQFVDNKVKGDTIAKDIESLQTKKSLLKYSIKQYIIVNYLISRDLLDDDKAEELIESIPAEIRDNIDKYMDTKITTLIETYIQLKDKGTE